MRLSASALITPSAQKRLKASRGFLPRTIMYMELAVKAAINGGVDCGFHYVQYAFSILTFSNEYSKMTMGFNFDFPKQEAAT
jgi:hypothetical protein